MSILVSASVLSSDFGRIAEDLAFCQKSGIDRIHIDVMDGHFVPNITIGPVVVSAMRRYTSLPLEAHLMIENPWDYIDMFIDAGADEIGLHIECYGERKDSCLSYGQYPKELKTLNESLLKHDIEKIKSKNKQVCLVINPGTAVELLDPVFDFADCILVMAVNPGFSGQKFMPIVVDKIQHIKQRFEGLIAVDGGINDTTAQFVKEAGANLLITASYFFSSQDPVKAVQLLKQPFLDI